MKYPVRVSAPRQLEPATCQAHQIIPRSNTDAPVSRPGRPVSGRAFHVGGTGDATAEADLPRALPPEPASQCCLAPIAHSHIGMVKRGDRPISARIARALGYERLTEQVSVFTVVRRSKRRYVYRRIEPAN